MEKELAEKISNELLKAWDIGSGYIQTKGIEKALMDIINSGADNCGLLIELRDYILDYIKDYTL